MFHRISVLLLDPLFISSIVFGIILILTSSNAGASNMCGSVPCNQPIVHDPNLKVEMIYQGDFKYEPNSESPVSSMTFLGPHDILILNKNDGTVHRILNNTLLKDPLLDINVANERERGLLGIATSKDSNNKIYVYLYYTESEKGDGNDDCPRKQNFKCNPDNEPIGNRLYKYELKSNKLVNPKLLLDLPASPSPAHNGGVVTIGPDNNLYVTIGDLLGDRNINSSTTVQNFNNGTDPDGRAGILRIAQDGSPVSDGILGKKFPLNLYYAYGIRNSFGIDFDPLTRNLWDTENGPEYGDEINLVQPGFNSGWKLIQGIWKPNRNGTPGDEVTSKDLPLVNFDGKGKYSSPEFIWKDASGVTAVKFLNSDKLGKKYENDLFVASVTLGIIYHFDLNKDRTALKLNGSLSDKIADDNSKLDDIIFAQGLGGITDIDVGPDGYLYVLSNYMGKPTIFRIVPIQSLVPFK
jgi:aldose sugar dehydrogenase